LHNALFIQLGAFAVSLFFACVLLPRPRKLVPHRWVRYAGTVLLALLTLGPIVYPWIPLGFCEICASKWQLFASGQLGPKGYHYGPMLEYIANTISVVILTPMTIVCMLAWTHPSSYATHAVRVLMAVWLSSLLWFCQNVAMYCGSKMVTGFFTYLCLTYDPMHWCATMVLFLRRYEQVVCKPNDRPILILVALVAAIAENLVSITPVLKTSGHKGMMELALSLFGDALLIGFAFVCAWPLMKAFHEQRQLLLAEMKKLKGVPKLEATWAAKTIKTEMWAVGIGTGSTVVMRVFLTIMLALKAKRFTYTYFLLAITPYRIYNIMHGFSLLVLSGLLFKQQGAMKKPSLPSKSDVSSASRFGAEELTWNHKVRELANRGFELGNLLEFMEDLVKGEIMPTFNPERSTTNDVVRQAIIPLSKGSGSGDGKALATIWNEGRPVRATRMVTHNWSNLFSNLVAAIIADGLGEGSYESVIPILATIEGIDRLRGDLLECDALRITYWVCAFSINQHASICSGFGHPPKEGTQEYAEWCVKTCDSVSKEPFCACTCQTQKHFNNEPALTELNKFDDMMALLANEVSHFGHIVAVDKGFDVFMRAWCVAEMVEGGTLHLPQRVIIHSNDSLEKHYMALANLDVRLCRATRPEDKEEILAKIEDISTFNEYLQWLLFDTDGLFGSMIDQEARLNAVGSILQRIQRSDGRFLTSESNAEESTASSDSGSSSSESVDDEEDVEEGDVELGPHLL